MTARSRLVPWRTIRMGIPLPPVVRDVEHYEFVLK